jgi:hypothetical protein
MNDKIISLFNAHKHTVMDVMVQEGINPKILIGKNGKNIRFTVDGIKRVSFGTLAKGAEIKINNIACNIDSKVKEGDVIEVDYCKDGKDAEPRIMDFVKNIQAVSFYFDDKIQNMEPVPFINGERVLINSTISEDDDVNIEIISTMQDYVKHFYDSAQGLIFIMNNKNVLKDYAIQEGDRIYSTIIEAKYVKSKEVHNKIESAVPQVNEVPKVIAEVPEVVIEVNEKIINLTGKDKYIFIDIFNYVDFDLSKSKGNLILMLNGIKASYHEPLKNGDIIQIYWENK